MKCLEIVSGHVTSSDEVLVILMINTTTFSIKLNDTEHTPGPTHHLVLLLSNCFDHRIERWVLSHAYSNQD